MGMHPKVDVVMVGGSVVAGAVSVTLLVKLLSLLLVLVAIVPLSARLELSPSDPVSVAAASTTRALGSWSGRMKRGLASHSLATVRAVRSKVSALRDCMASSLVKNDEHCWGTRLVGYELKVMRSNKTGNAAMLEKCRSSGGNGSSLYRLFMLPSFAENVSNSFAIQH